jgi:CRISPR/Cas system CSM-associated protein Csm3 (group 7 of RAMP superfamily)
MAEERFRLQLKLTLQSDLHIAGPGRTLPLVDRSVEINEQRQPIIPASSFRGRLRAELERILQALGQAVCTAPRPDRMCPHAALQSKPVGEAEPYYCRACRIFGSAWRLSAITLTDLLPETGFNRQFPLRTGVSINRRLGAAEEQRLYMFETVPHQQVAHFSGKVEGWLTRDDLGWLLAGVKAMTHIGSGKARGLGRIQDVELSLQVYDLEARQWQALDWEGVRKEALENDATESNR